MKFSLFIISVLFSMVSLFGQTETKIATAFGPEDILLDSISSKQTRLIISCTKYKGATPVDGTIQYYYPNVSETNATTFKMDKGVSETIRPHGIAIAEMNGKPMLYVVSHENDGQTESILVFEIKTDELIKVNEYKKADYPNMIHPNDLHVAQNGMLYYSNYPKSLTNYLFKKKNGNIAYINTQNDNEGVLINKLPFPNGLIVIDEVVYFTDTATGYLNKAELTNKTTATKPKQFLKLKGGDNINQYGNSLIIASHPKPMRFMAYMLMNARSPSQVTSYNLTNNTTEILYDKTMRGISGSSTALIYDDDLYISQVKQPFVLRRKIAK